MASSGREHPELGGPSGRPKSGGKSGGLHMANEKSKVKLSGGGGGVAKVKMHAKGNAHSDGNMRAGSTRSSGAMKSRFDTMAKKSGTTKY